MQLMPLLATQWSAHPSSLRQDLLTAAAAAVRQAWRDGFDVTEVPLALLRFDTSTNPPIARLPPMPAPDRLLRPHPGTLRNAAARWLEEVFAFAPPEDARLFARSVFAGQPEDQAAFHCRRAEASARASRAHRVAEVYRRHLAQGGPAPAQGLRAYWEDDPLASPLDLMADIQAAESALSARVIKTGPAIQSTRTLLRGRDVLIKRFSLSHGWSRLKYRYRPSRARRAWAAASTLRDCRIDTPTPLGFLEVVEHSTPIVSYAITEWIADADTAYRWVKQVYSRGTPEVRATARAELLCALQRLYGVGLYHNDTKLMNLLVRGGSEAPRRWLWIDLESLGTGCRIGRRQLLRNLVQLNGSARHWVPEADRMDFLCRMADAYPVLKSPGVADLIRKRSHRRLVRERTGRTPPDGVRRP